MEILPYLLKFKTSQQLLHGQARNRGSMNSVFPAGGQNKAPAGAAKQRYLVMGRIMGDRQEGCKWQEEQEARGRGQAI